MTSVRGGVLHPHEPLEAEGVQRPEVQLSRVAGGRTAPSTTGAGRTRRAPPRPCLAREAVVVVRPRPDTAALFGRRSEGHIGQAPGRLALSSTCLTSPRTRPPSAVRACSGAIVGTLGKGAASKLPWQDFNGLERVDRNGIEVGERRPRRGGARYRASASRRRDLWPVQVVRARSDSLANG